MPEFRDRYQDIIRRSVDLLADNRFACILIGDVRDKEGYFRDLPGLTVDAFRRAGLKLYNRAVLATALNTGPLRARRQWPNRKLVAAHQDIFVFVKGDYKAAAANLTPKE